MTPTKVHAEQVSHSSHANATLMTPSADANTANGAGARYELRFHSLFDPGRGYAFPCDAAGHVALDALGERARISYFSARTLIGREFSMPVVQPTWLH